MSTKMQGIADYEFIRPLGDGNHGSFWLAKPPARLGLSGTGADGESETLVAVKTLAEWANDAAFSRMANELKLYASVDSPYLVELYDAGQQDGVLYYAGEYFPDGSLGQPSRPLNRQEVLFAVADAADAAHALHEVGVAHRDIKPGNIMVTSTGAKLGDLGLAQILNPGQTVTGIGPVGTIAYLAPEIIRGEAATRATDIWALGATLHQALTGRLIFPDVPESSLLDALRHVLHREPTLAEPLSVGETDIITTALAAEAADRHPTSAALASDIRDEAQRQLDAIAHQVTNPGLDPGSSDSQPNDANDANEDK